MKTSNIEHRTLNIECPAPITFPARPVNGGPLEKALPKHGDWYYEPKYNGWRALVHVPTGTMFNRKGEKLSIAGEFDLALHELQLTPFTWLDCEALERRHNIGRGSLIVLDAIFAEATYKQRRECLEDYFRPEPGPELFECQDVYLPPQIEPADAESSWRILQSRNVNCRCEFYEGLVAKRADSLYPIQLRSPDVEFPFWMKHRWAF